MINFNKDKEFSKIVIYEKKLIQLRKQVNEMYFNQNFSKSMIAKKKRVSRNFVIKWTESPNQDFSKDKRGWIAGKRRKWGKVVEDRIKKIHQDLKSDPHQFYTGATAIEQEWRRRYCDISPPLLRTIGQILSDLGLSEQRKRHKQKGAAKYLCYPEHTIYTLFGGRVLEVDFIGKKYIAGRTKPLNFIGFSFKKEPKLRYFRRIEGQTAENFIKECKHFFQKFEKPDFLKVDNCLATIGSASGRRNLSRTMKFLLKNQVIPIFSVPRRPFSQASIEGNNSVFARRFWNKIEFKNIADVDKNLEWFNISSQQYTGYQRPKGKNKINKKFCPRIYFIRQVRENEKQSGKAFIDVLNEKISLPSSYINYFVLAEWNLKEEMLYIYFEKECKPKVIKKLIFKINPRSKKGIFEE